MDSKGSDTKRQAVRDPCPAPWPDLWLGAQVQRTRTGHLDSGVGPQGSGVSWQGRGPEGPQKARTEVCSCRLWRRPVGSA